jgi:hypothetical protein
MKEVTLYTMKGKREAGLVIIAHRFTTVIENRWHFTMIKPQKTAIFCNIFEIRIRVMSLM